MTSQEKTTEEMTDAELIEAVAVEVMGWEQKPLTFPLLGVERCDKTGEEVIYWHEGGNSKYAVDKYYCHGESDGSYDLVDERFLPLTNWNHTMQVVEIVSQKHQFTLGNNYEHGWFARFSLPTMLHCKDFEEIGHNPQHAICLAALRAVRSLKQP